nr:hypothetical protein [Tanacetum cinerariifolium]
EDGNLVLGLKDFLVLLKLLLLVMVSTTVEGFVNSSEMLENQENVKSKFDKTVKTIDVNHKCVFSTEEPKPVMKNSFSPLIIEDWHSDNESEIEISPKVEVKIVKPSVDKIKFIKNARETVKNEESPKQYKHHPRGNQRNWNNLMSQRL